MAEHRMEPFTDRTVELDGQSFNDCIFTRCVLVFRAVAPVAMSGCSFDACEWRFEGPAQDTLGFMRAIYHGGGAGGRALIEQTFENMRRP